MIDISVVIPAYNVAEYIGEALESVLRQDPPFKQIIVVDDGSKDATANVVASFTDERILYQYHDNCGLGPTRNIGIDLADAEYICFMDSDDILADHFTKVLATHISTASPDAVIFSAQNFSHETGRLTDNKWVRWQAVGHYAAGRDSMVAEMRYGRLPAVAFTYVVRTNILNHPPALRFLPIIHEDEVFTPQMLLRCGPVVITNQTLYRRRMRAGSIVHSKKSVKNIIGRLAGARLWQQIGATASHEESALFLHKEMSLYRSAIYSTAKVDIDWGTFSQLLRESKYDSGGLARRDFLIAGFSRNLASLLIKLRVRRLIHAAR